MNISFFVAGFIALSFILIGCGENNTNRETNFAHGKINWKDINQATHEAEDLNKKMFVYVHTDWCSWCRKMETDTFSDEAVAEYLNSNFIPVHIDAESNNQVVFNGKQMSERDMASSLGAQGYPSNIFLTSSGERITIAPGYLPPERFLSVLSFIAEDHYKHMQWDEYLENKRS